MTTGISRALTAAMIVLAAGVLLYAAKTGTPLRYIDEKQYLQIAQHIADGDGYLLDGQPTAFRPPVWPLLLATFLFVGMPVSLMPVVSALCMIGAAVIAANIGTKLAGPWGKLAGVAMLLYPLNIYTAATLYPQALATLLIVGLWWCALRISEGSRDMWLYGLTGLLVAALALSVPTLVFTGVAVAVWVLFAARGDRFVAGGWIVVAAALPVAVWAGRNATAVGSPVPISTSGGVNLLIGNNPSATATTGVDVDITEANRVASRMGEVEADRYLRGEAVDWITHHPVDALTLYGAKVLNYFAPYNEPVTATGSSMQRLVAYAGFTVLVALLIVRLVLRKQLPVQSTEWLFLTVFAANSLVMAVFFTRTRFRQPLDSVLLIEAGLAVAAVIAVLSARRWPAKSPAELSYSPRRT